MEREGIDDPTFASMIGRDRSIVSKLRRGIITPTLDIAAKIERITSGAVPMQAWVDPHAQNLSASDILPHCPLCETSTPGEIAACTCVDCPNRQKEAA